MPWNPKDLMSLRLEFIELALKEGCNRRELCRRFGISPKTGYKWLKRAEEEGLPGLMNRSRKPVHSPRRTPKTTENAILSLRRKHPAWGGRKIKAHLESKGHTDIPSPATITAILHRQGLVNPAISEANTSWKRFEHSAPNELWQMDFKGYVQARSGRYHPLTVLDDHSRYNLLLQACERLDTPTVQTALIRTFERYGLPDRINTDNGIPWGSPKQHGHGLSKLTIWLIRLGIRISKSRPFHPQTNGKLERFHRSLEVEVLKGRFFKGKDDLQSAFDRWHPVYNQERPHEALAMAAPVSRYSSSKRSYTPVLSPIEYAPDDFIVYPKNNGWTRFKGYFFKVPNELVGLPVALRPNVKKEDVYEVYFCHHRFMSFDLHKEGKVKRTR